MSAVLSLPLEPHEIMSSTPTNAPELAGAIYTLGTGDMLLEHISRRCEALGVEYLIDLRSPPYDFNRRDLFPHPLSEYLAERDIRYVNMHQTLGDRPEDVSVYVQGGRRVDYRKCYDRPWALQGMQRLLHAHELGLRICLLDREPDPRKSHRARFLGPWLAQHNIATRHLAPSGAWLTQREVEHLIETVWDQKTYLAWVYTNSRG